MRNAVKAVIVKAENKILSLKFDGAHYDDVKSFMQKRKLGKGSVILVDIKDKEARSLRQNRTFHLFVSIALKSDLFGDDFEAIKKCFKQSFGKVYHDWKDFSGEWHSDLESTAKYTMEQFTQLMRESLDHMLKVFNHSGYYDDRMNEIVAEFNGSKQLEVVNKVFRDDLF